MHLLMWMAALCLLSACAGGPQPTPAGLTIEPIRVPPPANLTQPPPLLPAPASGQMRDLEANHRQVAQAYHQLASQMCGLLSWLQIDHEQCRRWAGVPTSP